METLPQLSIQPSIDSVNFFVVFLDSWIRLCYAGDGDTAAHRFTHIAEQARADAREQRRAIRRSFLGDERRHLRAINIGLHLSPKGAASTATGRANLAERQSQTAHNL